jgi:hypothetical protein
MVEVSLEEARSLAGLFGELDRKKMLLLLLFDKPGSKWDKKDDLKKLAKPDRISTATLYRDVNELKAGGFLEEMKGSERRARSGTPVLTYRLTFKGCLAEAISAHLLLLEGEIPPQLKRRIAKIAKASDSSPGWPVFIEFLKYHRELRIDLSRANIDAAYFSSMLSLALRKYPEDMILKIVEPSLKELGIDLPAVKEIAAHLKNRYDGLEAFGESFLAEVAERNLKPRATDVATKVLKLRRTKD